MNEKGQKYWMEHFPNLEYAPIDQATLQKIYRQVTAELGNAKSNDVDSTLFQRYIIFSKVSEHCKNVLGEKRVAAVYDDICRDDIRPTYFNMYDPIEEQFNLGTNLTGIEQNITDYCGVTSQFVFVTIRHEGDNELDKEFLQIFCGQPVQDDRGYRNPSENSSEGWILHGFAQFLCA